MAAALLDLPMPSWGTGQPETKVETQAPVSSEHVAEVTTAITHATEQEKEKIPAPAPKEHIFPQGSEAAELAAAAKPQRRQSEFSATLPAPLVSAGPLAPFMADSSAGIPLLPEPPALGAPLARAGIELPETTKDQHAEKEDSIWNMLDLKSLPIPVLGSVEAAHAAALDMPVPATTQTRSPFTPAEQLAPMTGQALPGSTPLQGSIPPATGADGAPIPPRYNMPAQPDVNYPPQPGQHSASVPPAPQINSTPVQTNANVHAQELARQQQDILILRQQMDQRLKDLQTAEDKMKGMLQEAREIEDKKVKSLVQMYANMKPRMAAQAMENMDERIAVRILSGMAPKQSGEILTYTNPAKTAKFTEMLTRMRIMEQ